jgi:N-acetylglutamate synthase-like GNAT family acetyltransferase
MISGNSLRTATPGNRASLIALLNLVHLPVVDLPQNLGNFIVHQEAGEVNGSVGLEISGSCALLRSLAVAPDKQGNGLGKVLYRAAEEFAARQGISDLYLLTTTAADFFARRGFVPLNRDHVPVAIRNMAQFQGLCPASATLMHRRLNSYFDVGSQRNPSDQ